jgi:hypothetical protein
VLSHENDSPAIHCAQFTAHSLQRKIHRAQFTAHHSLRTIHRGTIPRAQFTAKK